MSEEKEYSAYISYHTGLLQIYSLFSGFTFTAITIILTLFPDPSQTTTQITLFVLAILLDIFLLALDYEKYSLANCIRIAPLLPEVWHRWLKIQYLPDIGWGLWSMIVPLMFFLRNMVYLALASGIVTAFFIIFDVITNVKPFFEFRRTHPFIRK